MFRTNVLAAFRITQAIARGTSWMQPPRIKRRVLDYSDDCELLEIILPAEFETVTLE
jgi:hypothetical protein